MRTHRTNVQYEYQIDAAKRRPNRQLAWLRERKRTFLHMDRKSYPFGPVNFRFRRALQQGRDARKQTRHSRRINQRVDWPHGRTSRPVHGFTDRRTNGPTPRQTHGHKDQIRRGPRSAPAATEARVLSRRAFLKWLPISGLLFKKIK